MSTDNSPNPTSRHFAGEGSRGGQTEAGGMNRTTTPSIAMKLKRINKGANWGMRWHLPQSIVSKDELLRLHSPHWRRSHSQFRKKTITQDPTCSTNCWDEKTVAAIYSGSRPWLDCPQRIHLLRCNHMIIEPGVPPIANHRSPFPPPLVCLPLPPSTEGQSSVGIFASPRSQEKPRRPSFPGSKSQTRTV